MVNQREERWDIELNPELLGTVVMEPEALSVTGLWPVSYTHLSKSISIVEYISI